MEFNIKYKNGYVICSVNGLWLTGVGSNIQESIEDFISDYNNVRCD